MSPQRKPAAGARGGSGGRRGEFGRRYTPRRKVCAFCVDKIRYIDYKDVSRLRRYLSERGKIEPRRKTGTCATHQRALAVALKRARHVALLPYTAEHIRLSGMVMRSPDDRRRDFDRGPRGPVAAPAGDSRAAPPAAVEPTNGAAPRDATAAPPEAGTVPSEAVIVPSEATAAPSATTAAPTELPPVVEAALDDPGEAQVPVAAQQDG